MRKDNVDETALVTLEQVRNGLEVIAFVQQANEALRGLGYTEHGQRHAGLVAHISGNVLERLSYDRRQEQLAQVAGYLHDIGNLLHRDHHAQSNESLPWSWRSTPSLPR